MKTIDLSNRQVIDLSQNWDMHTPTFKWDAPMSTLFRWIMALALLIVWLMPMS